MHVFQSIQSLIQYGLQRHLLETEDETYVRNRLLALLGIEDWQECDAESPLPPLAVILEKIVDWAFESGRLTSNTITERDLFDTEIMNGLMPRPSEVIREFCQNYEMSPKAATDRFYQLSVASNYIRADRIAKNRDWKADTPYGAIDITINLSKPEKDPKEIALLKDLPASTYPSCLLCRENEGYKGTLRHPARATHRVIPVTLHNEAWFLQYSPYVYYKEHCIVFRKEHVPMKITRTTFDRLLDFVEVFPHYFIGSNADLPIVGGSILAHDHFQGGNFKFALERAKIVETLRLNAYPDVKIGIVNWPMSVIRITGSSKGDVAEITERIWRKWLGYSDPSVDIKAFSGETPHNTVTPIARRRGNFFEMDVVLRNNRTTAEFPDGLFHPHKPLHHIKKENIGLIEVMGLAILPGRLATELQQIKEYLLRPVARNQWEDSLQKHWDWYVELSQKYPQLSQEKVNEIIKAEVGAKFQQVLEDAGVFKNTEEGRAAFMAFLQTVEGTTGTL
ncbi:UDP-glucose--hexose-1-phosphate uridylyltransferase [Bacillus sp. 1NLA3E]|uniref:UDP-glucose--hexose-1-phosphate uridylyltransferase n=1 Tax=Bacillus sp. 1NLA3E TaxID=666686 RepID=UPI000247ED5F|nr:UDP-glucose--hexose-1-phosphate uridylyltransferase [Bacillus sp. 1NLA3E]